MTSYVIHALAQKRAKLSGDIENAHTALKRMIQELEHLDKTLLMFDPDYQVDAASRTTSRRWAYAFALNAGDLLCRCSVG